MKNSVNKVLFVVALLMVAQISAFAQTTGYTITDNGGDPTLPQRLYSVNLTTGASTLICDIDTVAARGNEYEGLASIGSVLYGVAENPDATSTSQPSDLRTFGNRCATRGTRQVGLTGINFGTEIGAAYNSQDGYIYVVASDDTIVNPNTATRLYRLSPTDGAIVDFSAGVSFRSVTGVGTGADPTPYLDGLAINNSGLVLATEARIGVNGTTGDGDSEGSLYALNLSNGQARYCGDLFNFDISRDTGASFVGTTSQLTVLLEDGGIYNVNSANCTAAAATVTNDRATLRTTITGAGGGDFEGWDVPAVLIR